jgi:hypothetical protein
MLVEQISNAVAHRGTRRRALAFLPVAASLLVAFLGGAMVGGVPGGSLLALLPVWSGRGWLSLANAVNDWLLAMTAAARTVAAVLPPTVQVGAVVVSLVGIGLVVSSAWRWREISAWRREP